VATVLVAGLNFARAQPADFTVLAQNALPAVVNISTTTEIREYELEVPQLPPGLEEFFGKDFFERFFGQRRSNPKMTSLGSGFVIDPAGYVVTNNHVIERADKISVILQDKTEFEARIIGRDSRTDLALLKITSDRPLPTLEWGDSDALQIGEWVVAIGNPFGLGGTVTAGIVSQRSRDIRAGPYDDFIQTDASINQGNSGGPLFNMEGKVVGVNTAILSPSGGNVGIGFATPSNLAKSVIDQLREKGSVSRGWLGVSVQAVTIDLREALGLEDRQGALVSSVVEGGPAERAGIQAGDVILQFGGEPIEDERDLARVVSATPPGKRVEVSLWRDRRGMTLPVEVGETEPEKIAPAGVLPGASFEIAGMVLDDLSPDMREERGFPEDALGVLVADVEPGSPAAERGFAPDDIITRLSDREIGSLRDLSNAMQASREAGFRSVAVLVRRDGQARFLTLPVNGDAG